MKGLSRAIIARARLVFCINRTNILVLGTGGCILGEIVRIEAQRASI